MVMLAVVILVVESTVVGVTVVMLAVVILVVESSAIGFF